VTDDHIGLKVLQAPTDECLHRFVDEGEGLSQGRGFLMPPEPRHTPRGTSRTPPGEASLQTRGRWEGLGVVERGPGPEVSCQLPKDQAQWRAVVIHNVPLSPPPARAVNM